jgi:hypothetical protein
MEHVQAFGYRHEQLPSPKLNVFYERSRAITENLASKAPMTPQAKRIGSEDDTKFALF